MRKLAALLCAVSVAGLLLAPMAPAWAAGKTHQMKATVVSVNLEAKLITIKDEKGEEKTAPVLDKAVEALKTVRAGDKVTVTCSDNEKGEHEGVSEIKVATS
jgi:beta-lactam-binding protein with PASTA domain